MPAPTVQILESGDYQQHIRRGAELLQQGKLVVLPMETVYGAAVLLSHNSGRARLRAIWPQRAGKALTPHLARIDQAADFVGNLTDLARKMMRKLWPGPVGLQFDVEAGRRTEIAKKFGLEESELFDSGAITLRLPDHAVFSDVAGSVAGPLAAAAAGNGESFSASDLAAQLDGKVDLIYDAGPPRFNKPSTLVKLEGNDYRVVRQGVYDERTIRRLMKTTILFVCSGNTCRSAMSEAIARKQLADRFGEQELEAGGIEVLSAGTMATGGNRATPQAAVAVAALGGDLSRHRSRPLTIALIQQADAIYTMSAGHSEVVTGMFPSAAQKVKTLDPDSEIDDPIGGDLQLYNDLAGQLWKLIERRLREQPLP
jgi:L-threonylcarbamoyladenylate synthase